MYQQFGLALPDPIEIYCNSQLALAMAKGEHVHKAAKHIDVKIHVIVRATLPSALNVINASSVGKLVQLVTASRLTLYHEG